MNFLKKLNVFTLLLAVFSFAFLIRLAGVATFAPQQSAAAPAATTDGFQPVAQVAAAGKNGTSNGSSGTEAASTNTAATHPAESGSADTQDQSSAPPPIATSDQTFSASEVQILQDLAKRRDKLNKRAAEIDQRAALLKAAGGEIDRKIAEMNKIRTALEDLLNKQKTAENAQIDSLVKIYQNMKPNNAAAIFNAMQMSDLLPVIGAMNERRSSPILAAMDPDKARKVTIELEASKRLPQLPADDPCKLKASPATLSPMPAKR